MSRNIYALLVGINAYELPVRSLRGCVNDIRQMESLLEARAKVSGDGFHPKVLTDAAATRQAILEGFRQHLGRAKAEDVAIFHFSGHGSQEKSPPEFWHLEPDRLDETLVCHDSRKPGSWDLADKELAHLIAEVSQKKAHVVIILDCCHSGSGTRNTDETGIRRVPTDDRERPLSTFLPELKVPTTRSVGAEKESGWVALPEGRHILLAACRSDEEAKEYSLGGRPRGVFSHFLSETLEQTGGSITYRELFKRVNALVRSHAALQSPQIEPTDHAMFDETFLGGEAVPRGQSFTLSHDAVAGWVVDAGMVHGIPQPVGSETVVFAIFPRVSAPGECRKMTAALGIARVRRVEPGRSAVEVEFGKGAPSEKEVYKAVLVTLPIAPVEVCLEGDASGQNLIRDALAVAGEFGGPSLLVREAQREDAELRLVAMVPGHYRTLRPADGRQLIADVEGFTAETARKAVEQLEHIARWTRIAQLSNPATELDDQVRMEIYTVSRHEVDAGKGDPVSGTELRRPYEWRNGKWRRPAVWIKLVNESENDLWFALVGLTQAYGVQSDLLPGGCVLLKKGENTWANAGNPVYSEVPDALWKQGTIEVRDVLKLIVSTSQMDATLLEQGDLDHPILRRGGMGKPEVSIKNVLNRLLDRVQMRNISTQPDPDEALADWTTREMSFTTLRPLESVPVAHEADTELYPGVKLLAHPALAANARLTNVPAASRDVDSGLVLPPLLRDDPAVSQPFVLSSNRGGAPGLSVLELFDVQNFDSVTPEQPLRIQIAQSLAPGEHVLAVTHDGEFFLPIGRGFRRGEHVEIVLDALAEPQNTRSLVSAVRIFFQKIVGQHFGTQYKYPLLAAFAPGSEGNAKVTEEPALVKAKVADAKRIVLYIHGIIGDTRGMVASAAGLAGPPSIPGLRDQYDLILTFDYENLQTPIEENARLLKQRLADAGLSAGHGKTLHIVAHSMGGLVSRWFIEREGGNKIVQHLVMLGTPNGGSPWPTVEDWAVAGLSLGLNGLTAIGWPANVLGILVSAIEKIDVALDQMHPGSEFLKSLHASPDPSIPYTIIAGNTSLIAPDSAKKDKVRKSLLERLKSLNLLHMATAPLFFGEANDIAVSVANILRQPHDRDPAAEVREVPCDHLTYFISGEVMRILRDSLSAKISQSPVNIKLND
jgi:pimeloyl-ACP methyl ester carboxylesterase